MYKKVHGTRDILPEEVLIWQKIEKITRNLFSLYNYQEIRTPVIEDVSLFSRSLGEFAEIVQKQMFLVKNKEDTYVLRPEGTAPVIRAYLENSLDKQAGFVKLFYMGPMFRLERPQKGRLRQFHHIGLEAIGSAGPEIDIEVIALADNFLKEVKVEGCELKINTLGCAQDKLVLADTLKKKLTGNKEKLCPECQERFSHNILRILDCKNDSCQKIVQELDIHKDYLCSDCSEHFSRLKSGLDRLGVSYEVAPQLVRGLDYYTRTVFEFKHSELGAQDAIGAGGRYDNLVSELGGPSLGCVGFAFGVERLLLASKLLPDFDSAAKVYLITLGEEAKSRGLGLLSDLRKAGIVSDTDYENKSLKAAMRKANDMAANFVLILGENELQKKVIMVKDMKASSQQEVELDKVADYLKNKTV